MASCSNFLKISTKFVICPCVPICHKHLEATSCLEHFINVNRTHHCLCNVNFSGWLKSIIRYWMFFLVEKFFQFFFCYYLFSYLFYKFKPFFSIHTIPLHRSSLNRFSLSN